MRPVFTFVLITALVFAGGYFYHTASAVCDIPITYRIGAIDAEFGLSYDEVRTAITDAESLWEDATGRNLFTYDDAGEVVMNFIFDARQERTFHALELDEEIEAQREMSEAVQAEYAELKTEYESLTAAYEAQKQAYEVRLAAYNENVARWNAEGGAPEEVFAELQAEQIHLKENQQELNATARQLNSIVADINALGEKGNALVSTYNNIIHIYNKTFSDGREFTQGDYQDNEINIYQYRDREELRLVLAHELGHALSLDHVENDMSIMYYLMGEQTLSGGVSEEDVAEFKRVCGAR